MMGTTTSAYKLRAVAGKAPVWEHVVLADATTKEGAKVQTWQAVVGESTIPAQGAWAQMKAATKQYRTKNN
jgi:hypothetical protein